jgi:hypothetical protein
MASKIRSVVRTNSNNRLTEGDESMSQAEKQMLETTQMPVRIKLSLLWASLMSLYIYNDYFSMYLPGTIEEMAAGKMGPLGEATEIILVAVAVILAIPAMMIFLSSALPSVVCRWLNVLLGIVYTAIELLTFSGSSLFYQIVVGLEILVTLLIVWYALRWPKQVAAEQGRL